MAESPLPAAVAAFEAEVGPLAAAVLDDIPGSSADRGDAEVRRLARLMVEAFIDSDGFHTDDELRGLIAAFADDDEVLRRSDPARLRGVSALAGARSRLKEPPMLFQILLRGDRRDGTARCWGLVDALGRLAAEVAALDEETSRTELRATEELVEMLSNLARRSGIERTEPQPGLHRPLGVILDELHGLFGLQAVKNEVALLIDLARVEQIRRSRGLAVAPRSRHLVFTGNPGTGKTTVARLVAEAYGALGVLPRGHLVEADRSTLVAGYVGQTAQATSAVVAEAIGGVLLIDEAYSLAREEQGGFGREAIDTLVKLMEDHRDELVVIACGYPAEMHQLIDANPGLRSRFPSTIEFDDYTTDQLVEIFELIAARSEYRLDAAARPPLRARFAAEPRGKGFGNGRLARNVFEWAIANQARRLADIADPSRDDLVTLTDADLR